MDTAVSKLRFCGAPHTRLAPGGRGRVRRAAIVARSHAARAVGVATADRRDVLRRRIAPNAPYDRDHTGRCRWRRSVWKHFTIGSSAARCRRGRRAASTRRRGRFRERLDERGAPLDVPHRAMVQARQIYVYSHAHLLGWHDAARSSPSARWRRCSRDFAASPRARGELRLLHRRTRRNRLRRARRVHARVRAVRHRVASSRHGRRDAAHARRAHRCVRQDASLRCAAWRVFDAYPATTRTKRQNPLMHLLEAYLALERAAPAADGSRAPRRSSTCSSRGCSIARRGVLLEHFAEDWSAHPESALADVVEPGHHFEWVWLLP